MNNKKNRMFIIIVIFLILIILLIFSIEENRITEKKIETEKKTYNEKIEEYKHEINKLKNPNKKYSDFKKIVVNKWKVIIKDNLIKKELNWEGLKKLWVEEGSIINEIINKWLNNDFNWKIITYWQYKVKVDKDYKITSFYIWNKKIKDSEIINKYIFEIDDLYKKIDNVKNIDKNNNNLNWIKKDSIINKIYNKKIVKFNEEFINTILVWDNSNQYWNDKSRTISEKIKALKNLIVEWEWVIIKTSSNHERLYIYVWNDKNLIKDYLIGKKYYINNKPYSSYIIKVYIKDNSFFAKKWTYVHFKWNFYQFWRLDKKKTLLNTFNKFYIWNNSLNEKDNKIDIIPNKQNLWTNIVANFINEYYKWFEEYHNDFTDLKEIKRKNNSRIKDFVYNKFYDINKWLNLTEQDLLNLNFNMRLAFLDKKFINRYHLQQPWLELFWTIFDEYNKKYDI